MLQPPGDQPRSGSILHVGCGREPLPAWLDHYDEVRLDIDPGCEPDIVAGMTDLGQIGPFDAVYSSHALEHLYPHDVPVALAEFRRVLREGGALLVFVPDLDGVQATHDVVYQSPSGPITGLDMIYGRLCYLKHAPHMAHHTGFTRETLGQALSDAGFQGVTVMQVPEHNLMGGGVA